jgi:hypothetical protein
MVMARLWRSFPDTFYRQLTGSESLTEIQAPSKLPGLRVEGCYYV